MTQITKCHAEWAVVDRLRSMLNGPAHAEYNVTQAYGLCVAILAWVMQRVRTPDSCASSAEDRAATHRIYDQEAKTSRVHCDSA